MTEREQIEKLLEVVKFYANEKNWKMGEFGAYIDTKDLTQLIDADFIDRFGGKKARDVLKELEIKVHYYDYIE